MAHMRDLIVNGNSRTFGTAYATKFEGPLTGNATSATKATQDGDGNTITSTYATASSLSSHTGNKSNPHGVTKAQVGLGSVANIDQSKAIKSITRSGTTFTATALDGTTTTFTQQDNNTTYGKATSSSDGLMSAADKAKLDGVASGANKYTHPGYTAHSAGLYKVTVDSQGHVSGATAVTKADITALGIPGQDTNTTYTLAGLGGVAKSGDTMSGSLSFSAIGDKEKSAGLAWSGSTDGAAIYYQTTAADQGNLVLNMTDDANTTIRFDWSGSNKAYIDASGVYHGTATYANSAGSANSVAWNNVSGKPSSYTPSSHTHTIAQVTNLQSSLDGKAAKSHTHAIGDITNLQSTINTINSAIGGKYSSSGGTLNGNLMFPGIPAGGDSKGVGWTSSDNGSIGAWVYYQTPADFASNNRGYLKLQVIGSGSTIDFDWGDTNKSYISSDGVYHGAATYAQSAGSANSVAWGNITGKPATYYTHPSYTSHSSGLYKVTVDSTGHVSAVSNVTKADITALGIPGQDTNTTYGAAGSSLGLMKSGGDLTISDGVAEVNDDSHNHHIIASYGVHAETASGTTANAPTAGMRNSASGMYMTQSYNDKAGATPTTYGNIINLVGAGTGQLFLGWSGTDNARERLYYRSHRDTGGGGWSSWGTVAYLDDVNKNYIGLSNVKNYDQSKAIKSITRSGTTFTATALDGTTTTFTQQDNNTTYVKATSSADGLMSAADKAKLDGIANGANNYSHPGYTAHAAGLYKVTVDGTGHVSAVSNVTKADITALGIPGQDTNTTYGIATSTTAGLVKSGGNVTINTDGTMSVSYASSAGSANAVAWANVNGKPELAYVSGASNLPSSYTGGDVWKAPS